MLFLLGLIAGCEGGDDSNACSEFGARTMQIVQQLPGTYSGTITDSDGDIECRYAGESFELRLELDDDACRATTFCPSGAFSCALSRSLDIADARVGEVTGRAHITGRRSAGLTVELDSDIVGQVFLLQGEGLACELGGVGGQTWWTWRHAEDGGSFEQCIATITDVP